MFDTTTDLSHQEQLSQIIRYVKVHYDSVSYEVKESFVDFVKINEPRKNAETLCTAGVLNRWSMDPQGVRGALTRGL